MLGGNRKYLSDPQAMEFVSKRLLFFAVDLIDRQKQRLSATDQKTREVEIGRREFAASVHHQNNRVSLFQRDLGLAKDLRRDEVFFVGFDSSRIHDAQAMSAEVGFAVEPVARDPRLIANNGAP